MKGILQPHGVETGWIPIGIIGSGPDFGVVIGPKAGDAKKLDGDQFEITFDGGDPNTPIARHRLSSDKDKPPEVQSGELAIITKFKHSITMNKDGSMTIVTSDKYKDGEDDKNNDKPDLTINTTAGNIAVNCTKKNNKGGTITHTSSDGDDKTHVVMLHPDNGITHQSSVEVKVTAPKHTVTAANVTIKGYVNVVSNDDGTGGVLKATRGLGGPVTDAILGVVPPT
ncbi:MAG: hypothetical protein ACREC4_00385 [Methylocella sp.]